jgi:uroporphyrin-III C-methyltransferase
MNGKVYLVGAGPGDPDLLTVKAQRLLRNAEVVLHDDLVSAEVLRLISPRAQLHNVGKRCGTKKITQEEIGFLMIALAESGLDVVRLKSGDPLIFGRLGEEVDALRKAGIEYEIVPGVTAAFGAAASLEIPLTHRYTSHAVVLITGQRASNGDEDWSKLVSSGATLVIYMPGHEYSEIASRLENAGLSRETPCAIVSRASTPQQLSLLTTLGDLPQSEQLPAPALIIVGEVVRVARASVSKDGRGTNFRGLPRISTIEFPGLLSVRRDEEPRP